LTLELALEWLASLDGSSRPFFGWVHFYGPHTPLEPAGAVRTGAYRSRNSTRPSGSTIPSRAAAELRPAHTDAFFELAELARADGRNRDASARYRRSLAIVPHRAAAHRGLAASLRALGEEEEANLHQGLAERVEARRRRR